MLKYISFEPTYIHVQEPGVQTVTKGEGPYSNISSRVREIDALHQSIALIDLDAQRSVGLSVMESVYFE